MFTAWGFVRTGPRNMGVGGGCRVCTLPIVRIDDELVLRPLRAGDVPTLGRWLRQPDLGFEGDEDNDDASVSERYIGRPNDPRYQWIIEHQGTGIGYFRWYPAYAPYWQDLHGYSPEERLYGFDIFVGELEWQGRGLGRRVVTGAAAHLLRSEATVVIVDVAETNERALRCYRAAGFDEVRRFDGEDGPSVLLERRGDGSPRLNAQHEANRRHWDRSAPRWRELRDGDGLWRRCVDEPAVAFEGGAWELIAAGGDLRDLRACVVGSGDAYAAFALAAAGARVTAVDISQAQLDVASDRADVLGLHIEFVRADAADLGALASGQFDLVVSTNGFFVWISDLGGVFAEVHRVLKPGGRYVFYDVHPFQRPLIVDNNSLAIEKSYWATGPHVDGDTFEFHWTVADLLNALLNSGLTITTIRESAPRSARYWTDGHYGQDETIDPTPPGSLSALPAWLTIASQRSD